MNEEQNYFLLVLCPFSRIYTYENGPVWTFFSLEGVISNCVKIIHSLSLVNLDFVILEYGNDLPAWFLRNEKLHTPSRTVLCVCV